MKSNQTKSTTGGFGVHDALYVIFKHKWKIMVLSLVGLAAAGAIFYSVQRNPTYESTAKLMVRYVVERATVDPEASRDMNSGGMMAEMEILTSRDTAVEVARKFGPERLMPDASGEVTAERAAGQVSAGLMVDNPSASRHRGSNFLYVSYRHEDPALAVQVLDQIVSTYFERHLALHRSTETFELVEKQTDQARSALRQTEEAINRIKEDSGVLTIEATMSEFEERRRGIREAKLVAETLLAEQKARVAALESSPVADDTDGEPGDEEDTAEVPGLTPEERGAQRERSLAIDEYRNLGQRLALLQQRRNELLIQKKPNHPMVRSLDGQIAQVRERALDLVETYPDFERVASENSVQAPLTSLEDERALASALEAKLRTIELQAAGLESEVAKLSGLGFQLAGLERQRQVQDEKYRYFQTSLERAQIDETLDPSKIPNISIIQSPSPAVKSIDEDSMKVIAGLATSGLIVGLGLAFLLEMVIDRRVSRPIEIETKLQLPLMMSIPYIRSKDGVAQLIGREPGLEMLGDAGDIILPAESGDGRRDLLGAPADHFIGPYAAAIRDRILFNFRINNIDHKPKLVAVAGLSPGAGVSTIAAGVAKAFAESGDHKVLLVDLNPAPLDESLQQQPLHSLVRALQISREESFRNSPRRLYFASAPTRWSARESGSLAPTRLHELMPYLMGSEFDYVIFDMPPVDATSPTLAMAGFTDKILLVLDAERTTKEKLRWGFAELEKGRADVSCIYNKARSFAPQWVEGAA